jgi:hypothetical protein
MRVLRRMNFGTSMSALQLLDAVFLVRSFDLNQNPRRLQVFLIDNDVGSAFAISAEAGALLVFQAGERVALMISQLKQEKLADDFLRSRLAGMLIEDKLVPTVTVMGFQIPFPLFLLEEIIALQERQIIFVIR